MTFFASPYQMNPLNYNPVRDLLAEAVNFERVRQQRAVKLFICATNVQTAKAKIYTGKELGVEQILASACLPLMMHAVEVDDEYYGTAARRGIRRSFRCFTIARRVTPSLSTSHWPSARASGPLRRRRRGAR
jgi:hypothetical protein